MPCTAAPHRSTRAVEAGGARNWSCPCRENRWLQMSDPYFKVIQEQWPNIRGLYMTYARERPIILYDIQDQKIYAYPYKEFKSELSENSRASLEHDYKSASRLGGMVVFVRDNIERKLVSYNVSVDTMTIQQR